VTRKRLFYAAVTIAVALGIYFVERAARPGPQHSGAGKVSPDFTLPDLSGGQLTLSSYRGKVVLLDFWATWCEPCKQEIPHFVEMQNQLGGQGLQIIGVSMDDTPDPVPAFVREFKINYPIVMGDAKIGELYGGVLGLPIAFLIDREGRIRSKHMGATDASVFEKEIKKLLSSN